MTTTINCTGKVRHKIEDIAYYLWAEGENDVANDVLDRHGSKIVLETADEVDAVEEAVAKTREFYGDELGQSQHDAIQRIASELYTASVELSN